MASKVGIPQEKQDELANTYKDDTVDKNKWRKQVTKLIREHPSSVNLLDIGKDHDHETHLTKDQFHKALPNLSAPLVEAIFDDIDAVDDKHGDGQVRITTIVRWAHNKKRRASHIEIKDENFIFNKLKKYQFKDLDQDENGTLDRDELHEHFDAEGVDPRITDVIFDNIDANGDGDISIKEWFQWQMKFKKKDLALLFASTESKNEEEKQNENEEKEVDLKGDDDESDSEALDLDVVLDVDLNGNNNDDDVKESPEPETEKVVVSEPKNEIKGKTNSWSLSKSISIEFDEYVAEDAEAQTISYPAPPTGIFYIKSLTNKWRECECIETLEDGKKWKIHYKDFSNKYDEIVDHDSERISIEKPDNVVPKREKKKKQKVENNKERRIWVQSGSNAQIHRECVILEENDKQMKVHFISYDSQYDAWIDRDSPRCQCMFLCF